MSSTTLRVLISTLLFLFFAWLSYYESPLDAVALLVVGIVIVLWYVVLINAVPQYCPGQDVLIKNGSTWIKRTISEVCDDYIITTQGEWFPKSQCIIINRTSHY